MRKLLRIIGGLKHHYNSEEDFQNKTYILEFENGDLSYMEKNDLHRLDGPALDWKYMKYFSINGIHIDVSSTEQFKRYVKLLAFL